MNFFQLTSKLNLSRDFKIICLHQTLVSLAGGMVGLFLPIFLFQQFNLSIYWVIVFYLAGHFLYALLVPFGAMAMNKLGLKKSMILGRFFVIPFYLSLCFFQTNPLVFAILANLFILSFRFFYWVPYHVDFVNFTDGKYRGRQMAYLAVLGYLVSVGAPLLAGLLLSQFSFSFLFVLVTVITTLAIFPLFKLRKVEARFEYSYFQTFRELFKKKNFRSGVAYLSDGAQSLVGVVIWPLFIYQILEKQYLTIGAVTALIIIGTIIFQMLIGKYTDVFSKRKLMKLGSSLYALGWLAKSFVETALQIFIIGTFHSFMAVILRTPFDALTYEQISSNGTYVDEYTVLREISVSFGAFFMGCLLIVLIGFFGLKTAFFAAAGFSLLVNLL